MYGSLVARFIPSFFLGEQVQNFHQKDVELAALVDEQPLALVGSLMRLVRFALGNSLRLLP